MKITKNKKWLDITPSIIFDWGHGVRIFVSWIYWTLEITLTPNK